MYFEVDGTENMNGAGESAGDAEYEADVKTLQNCLFPPQLTSSNSYFSNFFIKTTASFNEDDEELRIKIKESFVARELFPSIKDAAFVLQPPRWPTECQVLEERIKHISYIPPSPEPYYLVTGNECQPKPSGEECGIIVYQYTPISAVNYFSRSSVGGSRYLLSSNLYPDDESLRFESRFESGNLARAIRITASYYELHLRADLYTNRHMQWFYFRVSNMKKNSLYRFSITNCSKESSLYNEGMRPLMYSTKDSQLHSIGWTRCGSNISYFSNDNVTSEDPDQPQTYTLTFTVTFPHEDDEVYLAHCYPYTYSDLQEHLAEIRSHPVKQTYSTVRLLCRTLAGNDVYFVTITSPQVPGEPKKKRAVVITARVHPGETPSSWIMKGILDFLTGDSAPAKDLRDKFIFKIVPMLNPDGVIVGNNRCSLSARDLNRQYRTVMRDAYPSIWYTKLMVRRLLEECGVALYCDLHAHSRKHNIFIYGCENRRGGDRRLQEQVFPLMLHKNTADKFSFESCKFRIQKAKEGTGRVVMWMMGIANSYTLEASFAGSILGARTDTHFSTQDFEQMGKSFCQTLLDFYDEDPRKERLRTKIIERLTKEGSNADEPTNIPLSDYSSDEGDTSSSSDEVGRDDKDEEKESSLPNPPPPSPAVVQKRQSRPPKSSPGSRPKVQVTSRSPGAPSRKPLPICKATLKLSLSDKEYLDSSSESEEDEKIIKTKIKFFRKKRKKKKVVRKRSEALREHSDSEVSYKKTTTSLSVFDLIANEKIPCPILTQRSRTPQPKILTDKKSEVTKQLAEVQAKLYTLKNKLWFGVGQGDSPLACGGNQFYFSSTKTVTTQKVSRKMSKKNGKKSEKNVKKEAKSNLEKMEKTGNKGQNGYNIMHLTLPTCLQIKAPIRRKLDAIGKINFKKIEKPARHHVHAHRQTEGPERQRRPNCPR
ncbi:cytosolic carboxypeptidase Nna1-like isoform X2 [Sitophilus oryzae]|uniref:Cytosolic carboxypeptidase Nna1-like isoform X2 n=1 Tax=Sitophilus oryzae TaxID=7048 RepID=A0A6J2YTC9_SITOR|nr:cytosolic carboxypeptidase Nna1-like isoform X2 [Sitophilus oryzae]